MRNCLVVKGVRQNNLRDVSAELPRNALTVFTRVSGAGKSSLVFDAIFVKGRRRYAVIGQKGASGNPRSMVGAVAERGEQVRRQTPQQIVGRLPEEPEGRLAIKPGIRRRRPPRRLCGRCGSCRGDGMIRGEANFLPGVYVPCARARYNRATLEVSCRGRSSADVLSLGRSATTLSGGEAQRVGLARRVRGCSLFVLDGTPEQVAPHPGRFPHSPSEA